MGCLADRVARRERRETQESAASAFRACRVGRVHRGSYPPSAQVGGLLRIGAAGCRRPRRWRRARRRRWLGDYWMTCRRRRRGRRRIPWSVSAARPAAIAMRRMAASGRASDLAPGAARGKRWHLLQRCHIHRTRPGSPRIGSGSKEAGPEFQPRKRGSSNRFQPQKSESTAVCVVRRARKSVSGTQSSLVDAANGEISTLTWARRKSPRLLSWESPRGSTRWRLRRCARRARAGYPSRFRIAAGQTRASSCM